jgi:exopolysaccharide biosynthesis protein
MHSLGAYNAMNLDGGASSGLYYGGRYLTAPGRDLSNALIIYKKND